ncbi:aminotransferase class I/II-fold pyridoxal phosphate-dependent enzyme [Solitalea sp. MAHUQ-68]|uniref:Aminotransferase class I/II-fold pyridoxal phosphate-dependent enzyme n=1 Tax=Solitalea agri TaxID=2953739 RepID=A0A9X2F6J0_9SPHI|nr:aminotransferase class I/II-fold pyridoxal phosphate-dependent enzyme [Solitalea agri]MCO4292818.1 aminotransferase class I/II-fold pyridoxal phosphate-dependent enzyme [Solitalea agri]
MFNSLNISGYNGRNALLNNEEHLVFAGTSYLGIAHNTEFRNYLIEGFELYGNNFGSSRIGNVALDIFETAENRLAEIIGSEKALTVSSGMLAGQMVLRQFEDHAHLFIAPGIHPALKPLNHPSRNYSYEQWSVQVLSELHTHKFPEAVIFINTVDILHARRYDLSWLHELPNDLNLIIVIDDSHGFGVIGEKGEGYWPLLPKGPNIERIMISSLGKAMGIPAGVIAGNVSRINKIKFDGLFGGSSPTTPAYLYAFLHANGIYSDARERLKKLITHFSNQIRTNKTVYYSDGLPVYFINNKKVYEHLLKQKIVLSSFPYPQPQSEPITRAVINSTHSINDIELLASALIECLKPL